jgi:signal transduction histidine kinase
VNKKLLYILIVSICISLLGIIVVQFLWIRNAFQVKEAQFDRSVNDALASAVGKLETHENMYFISRNYEGDSILSIVQAFSRDTVTRMKASLDSLLVLNNLPASIPSACPRPECLPVQPRGVMHYSYHVNVVPPQVEIDTMPLRTEEIFSDMPLNSSFEFNIEWNDQREMIDSLLEVEEQMAFLEEGGIVVARAPRIKQRQQVVDRQEMHARKKEELEKSMVKLDNKARKIQNVIKKMALELETKPAPVQQRINKKELQSTLSKAFVDKGIDLPFEFAVYTPANDSNILPIQSTGFDKANLPLAHQVTLFPNDLIQKHDKLMVYFPGQKSHVVKSLLLLLVGSILFTLIIVMSSGASIVVMIRQKKISDIKTDFINNMTHEFKTPIATISIAADSINNPKVIEEPERIRNFTRIIKEENNRMNARVEQVLQMALLDSRDFKLRSGNVDMHYLIDRAVDHFRLQIEKREGLIVTRLEAEHARIDADEDHIRNVLMNLLDNANKYSAARPDILVTTFNRGGKFYFTVRDNGIGMNTETQRKIFDKFYRVTTGNIHSIKGFGLGLSYVRAIVLAHQGELNVNSELGKGTTFEIGLPLVQETA